MNAQTTKPSNTIGIIGNRVRGRMAIAATSVLIVTALAVRIGYAGEPGGQSVGDGSNRADSPTAYQLMGDSSLNNGTFSSKAPRQAPTSRPWRVGQSQDPPVRA